MKSKTAAAAGTATTTTERKKKTGPMRTAPKDPLLLVYPLLIHLHSRSLKKQKTISFTPMVK